VDFRLSLLGGFGLAVDGKHLKFATRKESSLYAYLTLHQERGAIRRERLAGLLWPDVDEQRARRNLSTALWRIKVALDKNEASSLSPHTSGEAVGIKLDPNAVDVLKFQGLLEDSERHDEVDKIQMLQEAESLYSGDLLDEYEDEWCEEARRHLRAQYVNVLRKLSAIHKNQAEYGRATQFTRKLVAIEPLDEESHKELMLLYHLSGDRHAALDQYETLRKNLQDELGIEPNESTAQLWEYIRTSVPDTAATTRPTKRGNAISTDPRIPLVGRQKYVNAILERIKASVEGRGSAVLVAGEAGIGKTKLVETLATEARLRDLQILQGRCPELQNPPPYQVIFQALWPRVTEAIRTEDSGSLLGAIVKVLSSESTPPKRTVRKLEPTLNTTIVMEAILELFRTDSARKPTLLILEDIHRIDQASLTLLATLLDRLPSMPLVVLATIRPDEKKADEIIPALTANGALHISLPPLDESELHRLVRAILRDKSVSRELLSFVWDRTDGVPLFALELVDFMIAGSHIHKASFGIWELRDRTSAIPDKFPSRVNEVIRRRIDLLDRQSKKTLVAAAILGIEFNLKHLVAITALSEDTIAENLNRLIDHRLIVEFEDRLRFRHETIRAVALEMLTAEKRRLLHLRSGTILEKTGTSQPEDLYIHFLEADRRDKALVFAEASGDKARGVHANINAGSWYTKAIELADSTNSPPKDRLRKKIHLLIKRHEVLEVLGDPNRVDHINSIQDLVSGLVDKGLLARIQHLRARTIARSKKPEEALVAATTACRLYREIADLGGEAAATETLGEIYLYLRDHDRAKAKLDRAIHLFRQVSDHVGEARVIVTGSLILVWGDIRATMESLERAETLLDGLEELQIRTRLLAQKGICYRFLGHVRRSENSIRAALELARRTGDRVSEARTLPQLAMTLSSLGRHAEAIREARRGIYLAQQTRDNRALNTGLNNAAYCAYRLSGALKHAKATILRVLRIKESTSARENLAIYKDTLATIYLEQGDVESALKVAMQARTLCSRDALGYVKGDVYHHLGTIYLMKKEYHKAIQYLQRAIGIFRTNHNLCNELLATANLTITFIESGESKLAQRCSNRISRMIRKVDCVEQFQLIFWSQYRAFHAAGRLTEARRALSKAYEVVQLQAGSLKGRNRHRFLSNLRINRTVLAEVARIGFDK
jgi:DNA-binding SARP family transcriptional activator/uncharacterized protein YqgQ